MPWPASPWKLVTPPDDRIRKYLTILEREAKTASRLIDPSAGSEAQPSRQDTSGGGSGMRA